MNKRDENDIWIGKDDSGFQYMKVKFDHMRGIEWAWVIEDLCDKYTNRYVNIHIEERYE